MTGVLVVLLCTSLPARWGMDCVAMHMKADLHVAHHLLGPLYSISGQHAQTDADSMVKGSAQDIKQLSTSKLKERWFLLKPPNIQIWFDHAC